MGRPKFKWQHLAPPGVTGEPANVPTVPDPQLRWQMLQRAKQELFKDNEDLIQLSLPNEPPINAHFQRFGSTGLIVYWMQGVAIAAVSVYLTGNADDDEKACNHVLRQLDGLVHPAVLVQYRETLTSAQGPFIYTIHLHESTYHSVTVGEWSIAIGMAFYDSLGLDGTDPIAPAS